MASAYRQATDLMSGKPRSDMVVRAIDGATIPNDPTNRDWQAYQEWMEDGNAPDAPAATVEPAKT